MEERRQPVAPKNEELLKEQNEELWNEYINGAWAHPSLVEVGGLLCRMPVPAQLLYQMRQLDSRGARPVLGEQLRQRLMEELPEDTKASEKEALFQTFAGNINYVYRVAERMVNERLEFISEQAQGGRLDPRSLEEADRRLVMMYTRSQDSWQSVCLVLRASADAGTTAAESVTINRPLARRLDEKLAGYLLNGNDPEEPRYSRDVVAKCIKAFGREAAVYLGGPDRQAEPALLVHGFGDLPGAEEVSTGTRIYIGGIEAAIDGVIAGTFSPLDFRWFVGRQSELSTRNGEWSAVACARPIALKQCLGLPKPLWHEVMELCGGESALLSRLEFVKRDDLEEDDA